MSTTIQLAPTATLFHADCRDALRAMADCSVDAVVTDPPYELNFMGKGWDNTGIANDPALWAEVFRVLKPGGHLAAFSASRTYHRMACAIEDAGFEIRDSLMWVYGTGFPKSQNVALAMDKAAGAVGHLAKSFNMKGGGDRSGEFTDNGRDFSIRHEPATDAAREWEGWGTALKPAFEPIVLARKPLSEGTVAANVLRWRTGALNIDASRINSWTEADLANMAVSSRGDSGNASTNFAFKGSDTALDASKGRWPANVVHDGSDEVVGAFPSTAPAKAGKRGLQHSGRHDGLADIGGNIKEGTDTVRGHSDAGGSAARFFYSAKASKQDRNGSKHPTVKPISLMEWLCTLITPPGGTILDPFGGSGTTAIAASNKGFPVILCEREAEYIADIQNRFGPVGPALPTPDALARFHAWNAKALELQAFLDSRVRQLA